MLTARVRISSNAIRTFYEGDVVWISKIKVVASLRGIGNVVELMSLYL